MNSKGWARMVVGCGATLGVCCGCEVKDVSVGTEGQAVNMHQCFATDCGSTAEQKSLEALSPSRCEEVGHTFQLAMQQNFAEAICPGNGSVPTCDFYAPTTAVGPDHSLWLLSRLRRYADWRGQYWLLHYAVDGALLGSRIVLENDANKDAGGAMDLVVDDDGNAWVAMYCIDAGPNADSELKETTWVVKYDPNAVPLLDPIPLTGIAIPRLATAPGQGVAIAGSAFGRERRGLMSLLHRDGTLGWTQSNLPTYGASEGIGVAGIRMNAAGQTTVFSERDWAIGADATYGLSRVDSDGRLIWDAKLEQKFAQAEAATLLGDNSGNLVVQAITTDQTTQYAGFSPSGEARWVWTMDLAFSFTPGTMDPLGSIYVPNNAPFAGGTSRSSMVEISPKGDSCVIHELIDAYPRALVAAGPDYLYFITNDSIGRIEPVSNP